jgi:hypothetical protein
MYVGAQIVLGWGLTTQEVVTILGITSSGYIFTTTPVNSHSAGETILAPTFPTQQPTDPHWTQPQLLGYLARANNEFLADCGCFYRTATQNLVFGEVFQNTPTNCIEINRVAASTIYTEVTSLTRASGEVTCVTVNPHGLVTGSTFTMQNSTAGFSGTFEVDSVPSPTSLTYPQDAADGTATGGAILYFQRLYESTQAEFTMTDRTWRNDFLPSPTAWAEDRAGLYRWLVNGKPSSNFPCELLMSVRDDDTFGLLSGFLIPDPLVYLLRYKVLEYCWLTDGVQQDPARAAYCRQRYDRGVMAVRRFLGGLELGLKAGA